MIEKGADVDLVLRENKYSPAFIETLKLCQGQDTEALEAFESDTNTEYKESDGEAETEDDETGEGLRQR